MLKTGNSQNGHIFLNMALWQKIRPLCFFQLSKLEKTKWSYFFSIQPYLKRYGHFVSVRFFKFKIENWKITKWPYLFKYGHNGKKKVTFFSPTLKVGENKVVLFFVLEPYLKRYVHFVIFWIFPLLAIHSKSVKIGGATIYVKKF